MEDLSSILRIMNDLLEFDDEFSSAASHNHMKMAAIYAGMGGQRGGSHDNRSHDVERHFEVGQRLIMLYYFWPKEVQRDNGSFLMDQYTETSALNDNSLCIVVIDYSIFHCGSSFSNTTKRCQTGLYRKIWNIPISKGCFFNATASL